MSKETLNSLSKSTINLCLLVFMLFLIYYVHSYQKYDKEQIAAIEEFSAFVISQIEFSLAVGAKDELKNIIDNMGSKNNILITIENDIGNVLYSDIPNGELNSSIMIEQSISFKLDNGNSREIGKLVMVKPEQGFYTFDQLLLVHLSVAYTIFLLGALLSYRYCYSKVYSPLDSLSVMLANILASRELNPKHLTSVVSDSKISELKQEVVEIYKHIEFLNREHQEKSTYLASMSHEIRNPLNALVNQIKLSILDAEESSLELKNLQEAQRTSLLLINLVNNVFDISKIEQGNLETIYVPISLPNLINDSISLIEDDLNDDVTVSFDSKYFSFYHQGDEDRIKQVLINILKNAALHTKKGRIEVLVERKELESTDEDHVSISIIDSGQGIPEEAINNIFKAYYSSKNDGVGLGLYISKKIIQHLGGEILCRSQERIGTEFRITLPLKRINSSEYFFSKRSQSISHYNGNDRPLEGKRILVVDDSEANRLSNSAILEKLGAEVNIASSGEQAITLFGYEPDLLLIDIKMEGIDGYETAKCFRERGYPNPIIALTGNVTKGEPEKAKVAGIDLFLGKPISPDVLTSKVYEWLSVDKSSEGVKSFEQLVYPGIDISYAMETLESDRELLRMDMVNFLSCYTSTASKMSYYFEHNDIEGLRKLTHKLRTDAANIGAREVEAICILLEDDDTSVEESKIFSEKLSSKLSIAIQSTREVLVKMESDGIE